MSVLSNKPIFYVYVYLDPRKPGKYVYGEYEFEYEPFYVGKGHGKRAFEHIKGNNYNTYFDRRIKKIQLICKHNPHISLYYEKLTEQFAFDLEKILIECIGRYDLKKGPLCNLTNGGEGSSGYKMSSKEIEKIRERMTNRIVSDKTRNKLREANVGKKHSNISKEKMSLSHQNKHLSNEHKQKISKGNKGKSIKDSVKENMRINNPMFNPIYRKKCLDKLNYRNKYNNPMKNPESIAKMMNNKRKIFYRVTNILTNEESIIDNMAEFCKNNKLNKSSMCHVVNGRQKEHRGFKCSHLL